LVAGLMVLAGALTLRTGGMRDPNRARLVRLADLAALPLLAGGMLVLWLDLGNGWNAARFYLTLQVRSPMSWGAWILLACCVVLGLRLLAYAPPVGGRAGAALAAAQRVAARQASLLAWLNVALGSALGLYTGVLLGTIEARPLWNLALAPLFLASGAGAAFAVLSGCAGHEEQRRLAPAGLAIAGAEAALLAVYLLALTLGPMGAAARESTAVLLSGPYALPFWGLVVAGGVGLPLVVKAVEVGGNGALALRWLPAAALPALVLIGGVALRWVIVYGGQLTGG
jgi:formate-dependent nitrite reductase membrane component NrfD